MIYKGMVRIAHLADIHIQDRRRAEYAIVFERLYASLRVELPDVIVVAGDVFDNKMRASAHNLEDVATFLSTLAAIAPVVLIAGNHDTNCLTPGALDLLTPLVAEHRALQPPHLTYWRHSGSYVAHEMLWTVIATDGGMPPPPENPLELPHICLFHEEVNGTLLPNGQQLADFKLTKSSFDRYDLAIGGHIHQRQRFAARAAYCGSLIQQNIGESHHGHGYILWEFESSVEHPPYRTTVPTMRGIDIPNDQGFIRIEIDTNGIDVTARPLPSNPIYWELIHNGPVLVDDITAEYTSIYGMPPRVVRPKRMIPDPGAAENTSVDECSILLAAQAASKTLEAHEEIIRGLLPPDEAESVIELHRSRWTAPSEIFGGKFRILRFEFDNLYAFGPANVVDFTRLEGCVSGVIASNHTGKSSLIEALVFALYEDHPRAPSKKDVIHRGAASGRLVLEFELDGKLGKITKALSNARSHAGESHYNFEYNGEDRTRGGVMDTLSEIESVIGSSVNALASSFQLQGGENGGFISATPAARKKLIANVMSLGAFDHLERATTKELTECGGEVKAFMAQFKGESEDVLTEQLLQMEGDLDDLRASLPDAEAAESSIRDTEHRLNIATINAKKTPLVPATEWSQDETNANIIAWEAAIGNYDDIPMNSTAIVRRYDGESIPSHQYVISTAMAVKVATDALIIALGTQVQKPQKVHSVAPTSAELAAAVEVLSHSAPDIATAAQWSPSEFKHLSASASPIIMPTCPRPTCGLRPGVAERRGPVPTQEAIAHAILAVANSWSATDLNKKLANSWSATEFDRIQKLPMTQISLEVALSKSVDANHQYQIAKSELAALRRVLPASEDLPTLDAITSEDLPTLDEALAAVTVAREWVTAAGIAKTISAKLRPQAECSGCQYAHAILTSSATVDDAQVALNAAQTIYLQILTRQYHRCSLQLKMASDNVASATALVNAAVNAAALANLSEAKVHYDRREARQMAIAVLESDNYWTARAIEAWQYYDERTTQADANVARIAFLSEARILYDQVQLRGDALKTMAIVEHQKIENMRYEEALSIWEPINEKIINAKAEVNVATVLATTTQQLRSDAIQTLMAWKDISRQNTAAAISKEADISLRLAVLSMASTSGNAKLIATVGFKRQQEQSLVRDVAVLQKTLQYETIRAAAAEKAIMRQKTLKAYRVVLRPNGGIGDILLEQGRAALVRQINNALRELGAHFETFIAPSYEVNIRLSPTSEWLPASLGSGYQKFVLSLATRLSIWRLSTSPRPDAFIIDEGFGACDEEYLDSMATAIEALAATATGPKLIFIVSHVDALKVRLSRTLEIECLATGSRVTNGAYAIVDASGTSTMASTATLRPDRYNVKNVYCDICKQSLHTSWATRHLASSKHIEASKKRR